MITDLKLKHVLTAATGSVTSTNQINGRIIAVHIAYDSSASTTDVTITGSTDNGNPAVTILTVTDNNTDGWFYPRVQVDDATGTAIDMGDDTSSFSVWEPVPVCHNIKVAIAQATSGKTITVTVLYER